MKLINCILFICLAQLSTAIIRNAYHPPTRVGDSHHQYVGKVLQSIPRNIDYLRDITNKARNSWRWLERNANNLAFAPEQASAHRSRLGAVRNLFTRKDITVTVTTSASDAIKFIPGDGLYAPFTDKISGKTMSVRISDDNPQGGAYTKGGFVVRDSKGRIRYDFRDQVLIVVHTDRLRNEGDKLSTLEDIATHGFRKPSSDMEMDDVADFERVLFHELVHASSARWVDGHDFAIIDIGDGPEEDPVYDHRDVFNLRFLDENDHDNEWAGVEAPKVADCHAQCYKAMLLARAGINTFFGRFNAFTKNAIDFDDNEVDLMGKPLDGSRSSKNGPKQRPKATNREDGSRVVEIAPKVLEPKGSKHRDPPERSRHRDPPESRRHRDPPESSRHRSQPESSKGRGGGGGDGKVRYETRIVKDSKGRLVQQKVKICSRQNGGSCARAGDEPEGPAAPKGSEPNQGPQGPEGAPEAPGQESSKKKPGAMGPRPPPSPVG